MTACAEPPAAITNQQTPAATPTEQIKVWLVNDASGASLADGLATAQTQLGVTTESAQIAGDDDYATAIQGLVDSGCRMVIGRGEKIAEPLAAAAKQNPEVTFVLVDARPAGSAPNLRTVVFNVHEASFLAGYTAASQSTTKTVGTFGALDIASVTIYMDGFAQGVNYWNEQHADQKVSLVGWDLDKHTGVFVQSAKSAFNDPDAGQAAAQKLVDQQADVIMPVAGESGVGALKLHETDPQLQFIWTQEDGCATQSSYCSSIVTSVVKDGNAAVIELIKAEQAGNASGVFSANLRNGGVHLTKLASSANSISKELDEISEQIKQGTIKVTSASAVG